MFVFGHLGIGRKIAAPFIRSLPLPVFFLGTLLPDLIDKPIYYGLVALTERRGAELELIHGTRTFGHTAILFLALMAMRTPATRALAIGALSHVALDALLDLLRGLGEITALTAFFWPLRGPFPVTPIESAGEHARTIFNPYVLGAEIVGALLLAWDCRAHAARALRKSD